MIKYKLGKLPQKIDYRTMRLELYAKELPPIPETYDCDSEISFAIPDSMDCNSDLGCCVISSRAKQTRFFESREQGRIIDVPEKYIKKEYFKEGGATCFNPHPDNGLVVLDSLKAWRKGWRVSAKIYNIYAFGEINHLNHDFVKACICLLGGIQLGLSLPISAQGQFERGEPWSLVNGDDGKKGTWGGHCIFVKKYGDMLYGRAWGKEHPMTWEFFDEITDEAYGCVDDRDNASSLLKVDDMDEYLKQITGGQGERI